MVNWFRFTADMSRKLDESEQAFYKHTLKPRAETWHEDRTQMKENLCLRNFEVPLLFDVPPTHFDLTESTAVYSPCARYVYCNGVLPYGRPIEVNDEGRIWFTDEVVAPVLMTVRPSKHCQPQTFFVLSPAEIIAMREGLARADGHVLVGGVGLGWFINKVICRHTVRKVTVIEPSSSLLHWLKPVITKAYPETKAVEWFVGDPLDHVRSPQYDHCLITLLPKTGKAAQQRKAKVDKIREHAVHAWIWDEDCNDK